MSRILRPCLVCGRPTRRGSRCPRHAAEAERRRQARQLYRLAYASPEYRTARAIRMRQAGGRCERILPSGERCSLPAEETNHVVPLSAARSLEEALSLCSVENLEAVCRRHHPRGLGTNDG